MGREQVFRHQCEENGYAGGHGHEGAGDDAHGHRERPVGGSAVSRLALDLPAESEERLTGVGNGRIVLQGTLDKEG